MKRVYLEITDVCNLDCPFCTNGKGHTFMALNDVKNYLDQIKEFTDYIYLHVLGEPLLHPDFKEIMNYLDKLDFNLQLVTNGTLLYKYPDLLNQRCLRKLSISLHSINNNDVNDNYFSTIDKLIEENNGKIIELRFYDFENLDSKLTDYFNILKKRYDIKDTKKIKSFKLKDNIYIYQQDLFKWPSIKDDYLGDTGICHGLKDQIAILHDGSVTACCLDPLGNNKIGDLNTNSLKNILNNTLYKSALEALNKQKLELPLCKRCTYRLRFNK